MAPNQQRKIALDPSWKALLDDQFSSPYMGLLRRFLQDEKNAGKVILPKGEDYFRALNLTPFGKVKVVVIGQDPYHGQGQACGLAFSVPVGVPPPPSLVNIYHELEKDLAIPPPHHGSLVPWGERGVLLLNAVLTVEMGRAASHREKGWERFTDRIVELLNRQRRHLVFMLWGSYAQKKAECVDTTRHLVLTSSHPSPFSANRGFLGSSPFSKANNYLMEKGIKPIDWELPSVENILE